MITMANLLASVTVPLSLRGLATQAPTSSSPRTRHLEHGAGAQSAGVQLCTEVLFYRDHNCVLALLIWLRK